MVDDVRVDYERRHRRCSPIDHIEGGYERGPLLEASWLKGHPSHRAFAWDQHCRMHRKRTSEHVYAPQTQAGIFKFVLYI